MQPEEQRTADCNCGRVCTYSPVQKLAQLQLSVNERSLRAKGMGKEREGGRKDESNGVLKEQSSIIIFFFFFHSDEHLHDLYLFTWLMWEMPDLERRKKKKINLAASRSNFKFLAKSVKKLYILRFWDFDVQININ